MVTLPSISQRRSNDLLYVLWAQDEFSLYDGLLSFFSAIRRVLSFRDPALDAGGMFLEDETVDRKRVLSLLGEIVDTGLAEALFAEFSVLVLHCEEEVFSESEQSVFFDYLAALVESRCAPLVDRRVETRGIFGNWAVTAIKDEKRFSRLSTLLAPLLYLYHVPFVPATAEHELRRHVRGIVKKGAASLSTIAEMLQSRGLFCSESYLRVVCYFDLATLLQYRDTGIWVVDLVAELPQFPLVAFNAKWVLKAGFERDGRFAGGKTTAQIYTTLGGTREEGAAEIDLGEIAVKANLLRYRRIRETRQGIEKNLHSAVVATLLTRRRAMRLAELEQSLGIELGFGPDDLGPGRIMAYARHERFLDKDEAFYVLSDWVETDFAKKGLIPRDRIVTPFKEKSTQFGWEELLRAAKQDDLARDFGLLTSSRLLLPLAASLPEKPVEPYYLKIIRKRLDYLLDIYCVPVSPGMYIVRGPAELSIIETVNEHRRGLASMLGVQSQDPFLDGASIQSRIRHLTSDSSIARQVLHFLRGDGGPKATTPS